MNDVIEDISLCRPCEWVSTKRKNEKESHLRNAKPCIC